MLDEFGYLPTLESRLLAKLQSRLAGEDDTIHHDIMLIPPTNAMCATFVVKGKKKNMREFTWQFTFKAFACATHARMRDVFELAPVINSDMTVELQSSSTQLYYMLVMVRQGVGAEVWRTLLWEYEPGVGIRYGAMLQSLLKRRFGEHDETDLAKEIHSFERDISKYEQQCSDLISDAIKHGIVCGGMAHQGLKQHIDLSISRLSAYKAFRDEIINYSRARRTWTDPNAMQVDAVHVNVNRNGRSMGVAHAQTRAKAAKSAKASSRREARARKEERKRSPVL